MKNTLLDYDLESVDITIGDSDFGNVPNYFSKNINIFEELANIKDMINVIQVQNNDKLERISSDLYGTTDYWDLLLMLNDRNPLFEMPFDDSVIDDGTDLEIENYLNIYSHSPLIQTRIDELTDELLANNNEHNEEYRYLIIIKPNRINDFISFLKVSQYI